MRIAVLADTHGNLLALEAVLADLRTRVALDLVVNLGDLFTGPFELDVALTAFAALVEPVEVRFTWRPQLADPGDEMVLDAAVNGQADALVTHNFAHFAAVAPRFGLTLLRPGRVAGKDWTMSKATDPLKLPASIKAAAAVAQKVGAVQTAAEFFKHRGEGAKPGDLGAILARVPDRPPEPGDEPPAGWQP